MTSDAKIILVTGGNSGIGLELVRLLAEKGNVVYIGARNEAAGKEAQAALIADGLKTVKFVLIDVRSVASINSARDTIAAEEGRLDALVNNAGMSGMSPQETPLLVDIPTVRSVLETNTYGAIETISAFAPLLNKAISGVPVVLNVSSALGSNQMQASGQPIIHPIGYSMSKAALNSYTIALAKATKKDGWKVNAVTPGSVATKLNGYSGKKTVREGGLSLLSFVLLDKEGPTGKFFNDDGTECPW